MLEAARLTSNMSFKTLNDMCLRLLVEPVHSSQCITAVGLCVCVRACGYVSSRRQGVRCGRGGMDLHVVAEARRYMW